MGASLELLSPNPSSSSLLFSLVVSIGYPTLGFTVLLSVSLSHSCMHALASMNGGATISPGSSWVFPGSLFSFFLPCHHWLVIKSDFHTCDLPVHPDQTFISSAYPVAIGPSLMSSPPIVTPRPVPVHLHVAGTHWLLGKCLWHSAGQSHGALLG